MNIREALTRGARFLELRIPRDQTPYLDASVLLAHLLGWSREKLLASYPDPLPEPRIDEYQALLEKRGSGVPVAYLTGEKEFFGRSFLTDPRVLIPRPDTEILVEAALEATAILREEEPALATPGALKVLDVCTGTGCIPLTLALEDPALTVHASDISTGAEAVFLLNRERLACPGTIFHRSDLLAGIPGRWHLITSNPPYLTGEETRIRMEEGWVEPALALDGGPEGLDLLFRLIEESADSLFENGYLILEADPEQMQALGTRMEETGFREIAVLPDLAGRDRVIQGRLRWNTR